MKMKKDIKWLKAEVEKQDIVMDKGHIYTDDLLYLIDQLDEPEVLTQEWIDKNVVHIRGLGDILKSEDVERLIVPNQEINYEDAIKVIAENIDTDEFSVGLYIEALNNNEKYEFLTDKWIEDNTSPVDDEGRLYIRKIDLQNLIAPKQELPVIPKYVADWIEEMKQDERPLYSAMSSLMNKTTREWAIWKRTNKNFSEIVAQAWLDGYEVDKVRYHVRVPYCKVNYYYLDKGHTGAARLFEVDENHCDFELTEDQIYKYLPGITKEYWEEIK